MRDVVHRAAKSLDGLGGPPGRRVRLPSAGEGDQRDGRARVLAPHGRDRRVLERGRERGLVGPDVEELRARPLLRLPDAHLLPGDHPRDLALGIVEVPGEDGPLGTDDDARGLEPPLHPVRAEVALRGRLRLGVDVEGVVRAGLHARLAADAAVAVEVDDPVRPPVERHRGADGHAGRVVAVVAAKDREVPARVRKLALLDVLHPRPERAERNAVLLLARHRAGVAPDAPSLVDHEAVAHASVPARGKNHRGETTPAAGASRQRNLHP